MHIAIEINEKISEASAKSMARSKNSTGLRPLTANDASSVIKRRNESR